LNVESWKKAGKRRKGLIVAAVSFFVACARFGHEFALETIAQASAGDVHGLNLFNDVARAP
jgi:hypothetical protein